MAQFFDSIIDGLSIDDTEETEVNEIDYNLPEVDDQIWMTAQDWPSPQDQRRQPWAFHMW